MRSSMKKPLFSILYCSDGAQAHTEIRTMAALPSQRATVAEPAAGSVAGGPCLPATLRARSTRLHQASSPGSDSTSAARCSSSTGQASKRWPSAPTAPDPPAQQWAIAQRRAAAVTGSRTSLPDDLNCRSISGLAAANTARTTGKRSQPSAAPSQSTTPSQSSLAKESSARRSANPAVGTGAGACEAAIGAACRSRARHARARTSAPNKPA
mmetsp:Transcript_101170/g.325068  ORF Transcript_101170/g.325068 Transcript_101170/m.325068 type:complete len:211 (-) Transcript_101170:2-634(-)